MIRLSITSCFVKETGVIWCLDSNFGTLLPVRFGPAANQGVSIENFSRDYFSIDEQTSLLRLLNLKASLQAPQEVPTAPQPKVAAETAFKGVHVLDEAKGQEDPEVKDGGALTAAEVKKKQEAEE